MKIQARIELRECGMISSSSGLDKINELPWKMHGTQLEMVNGILTPRLGKRSRMKNQLKSSVKNVETMDGTVV
eukprot:11148761-Ditylum_brightwellii.AAC.1